MIIKANILLFNQSSANDHIKKCQLGDYPIIRFQIKLFNKQLWYKELGEPVKRLIEGSKHHFCNYIYIYICITGNMLTPVFVCEYACLHDTIQVSWLFRLHYIHFLLKNIVVHKWKTRNPKGTSAHNSYEIEPLSPTFSILCNNSIHQSG